MIYSFKCRCNFELRVAAPQPPIGESFRCPYCSLGLIYRPDGLGPIVVDSLKPLTTERVAGVRTGRLEKPREREPITGVSPKPTAVAGFPDDWTSCEYCSTPFKKKNAKHHRAHCIGGSARRQSFSAASAPGRYHSSSSRPNHYARTLPNPNTCTRCGRSVMWPVIVYGAPYGSYCAQRV